MPLIYFAKEKMLSSLYLIDIFTLFLLKKKQKENQKQQNNKTPWKWKAVNKIISANQVWATSFGNFLQEEDGHFQQEIKYVAKANGMNLTPELHPFLHAP